MNSASVGRGGKSWCRQPRTLGWNWRKKYPDVTTFYCPLDFSWAVRGRAARPSLFVSAELELWPNLIAAVREARVPVAVVNGRLSERSFRGYRKLRPFMRRLLNRLSLVAVQNDEYREHSRRSVRSPTDL